MISLKNITKRFDDILLENFSIDFEEGKTTVILGKSGCGKTTVTNILLKLVEPDFGCVMFDAEKKTSVVFQEDRLLESLTVFENLAIVCNNSDLCHDILEELHLSDCSKKYPKELSGGMKRRVALGRALAYDGDVFVMDEPFKGIDVILKEIVMLKVEKAVSKKTAVIVTHEIDEAVKLGDRIVVWGGHPVKTVCSFENTKTLEDVGYIKNFIMKNMESDF